jgi:hypothetical protein
MVQDFERSRRGGIMFILQLNDMRSAHYEINSPCAKANTKEDLLNFVNNLKVEIYKEGENHNGGRPWVKQFKKDSPLEWCNPPMCPEETPDSWIDDPDYVYEMEPIHDMLLRATKDWHSFYDGILGV